MAWHAHLVQRGSMLMSHELDERKERSEIKKDVPQAKVHRMGIKDYTLQDGKVGRILNGRFVEEKVPEYIRIALSSEKGRN